MILFRESQTFFYKSGEHFRNAEKGKALSSFYQPGRYPDNDPVQHHPEYTADIRGFVTVGYVSCGLPEDLKGAFSEKIVEGYQAPEDEKTEQA